MKKNQINTNGFFHKIIKSLRESQGISQSDLCSGLYTVSMMNRIENGERFPNKMNRDILLGRLGVSSERITEYLPLADYRMMKAKNMVLDALDNGDILKTQNAIGEMETLIKKEHKAAKQFVLMVKARIASREENADRGHVQHIYEKAVACTIGQFLMEDAWKREQIPLSAQEINVLLEYLHVQEYQQTTNNSRLKDKYLYLLNKINHSSYDEIAKAKLLPKATYYYLRFVDRKMLIDIPTRDFHSYCDAALHMALQRDKSFFIVELYDFVIDRLKREIKKNVCSKHDTEWHQSILKSKVAERKIFMDIFDTCNVSPYVWGDSFIYQDLNSFSAGAVIKWRREMLGMSREDLSADIFDEKSLMRLENNRANTNTGTLRQLLKKLGIAKDICSLDIVAEEKEPINLEEAVRTAITRKNWGLSRKQVIELEDKLDMAEPINMQYITMIKALCRYMLNEISRENFIDEIKKSLQLTIDIKYLAKQNRGVLSMREEMCIYFLALSAEGDERDVYFKIVDMLSGWYKAECNSGGYFTYENLLMIAWIRYSMAEEAYAEYFKILRSSLKKGRLDLIHNLLTERLLNNKRRKIDFEEISAKQVDGQECFDLFELIASFEREPHYGAMR